MRTETYETPTRTRTVLGQVQATGVSTGPGWTATKVSVGNLQVRYSPPFRAPPSVIVSVIATSGWTATVANPDAFGCQIVTANPSTLNDAPVYFSATGIAR